MRGQRVIIVGGMAGMGLAIAKKAAAHGARVHVGGQLKGDPSEVLEQIGGGATFGAIDILSEASIQSFFSQAGECDHLVTTASAMKPGPFDGQSLGDARQSFAGKFWSQYLCALHAGAKRSILFFSGVASDRPSKGQSIVTAVNAAVEGLGRALAIELAPVRVNVVSPGLIRGTNAYLSMPEADREAMYSKATAALPAGLVAGPEQVANLALSILENTYMTGGTYRIDGGAVIA